MVDKLKVQLIGLDGNAFVILGKCRKAMWKSKNFSEKDIKKFIDEATSGDYDHLLQTVVNTFDCD